MPTRKRPTIGRLAVVLASLTIVLVDLATAAHCATHPAARGRPRRPARRHRSACRASCAHRHHQRVRAPGPA